MTMARCYGVEAAADRATLVLHCFTLYPGGQEGLNSCPDGRSVVDFCGSYGYLNPTPPDKVAPDTPSVF